MSGTEFHVRHVEAAKGDAQFISDAFDSTIPVLATAGSGAQWGPDPLSLEPDFAGKVAKMVSDAEGSRSGEGAAEGPAVEGLVAEVDIPEGTQLEHTSGVGEGRMGVAVAVWREDWWPQYVREIEHIAPVAEGEKDFGYLHLLVSDYRAGELRRGAGAALVEEVKERARARGKGRLWVDCWAGNGRKLVR